MNQLFDNLTNYLSQNAQNIYLCVLLQYEFYIIVNLISLISKTPVLCIHTHTYMYTCMCIYICMYVFMYTYVCVYVCMYVSLHQSVFYEPPPIHSMTNLVIGSVQLPTDTGANRLSGTLAKPLTAFS